MVNPIGSSSEAGVCQSSLIPMLGSCSAIWPSSGDVRLATDADQATPGSLIALRWSLSASATAMASDQLRATG